MDGIVTSCYHAHVLKTISIKPTLIIVKLGFIGVCIIFLFFALKHRVWILVRTASIGVVLMCTHSLCFGQK